MGHVPDSLSAQYGLAMLALLSCYLGGVLCILAARSLRGRPDSRLLNKRAAGLPALLLLVASLSHAALSQAVSAAVTNAGVNLLIAVSSIMGVMVVFWGLNKLAYKFGFGGVPDVGERYAYWDKDGKLVESSWTKKDDGIHKRRHGG